VLACAKVDIASADVLKDCVLGDSTPEGRRLVGVCASKEETALDAGMFELDRAFDASAIEGTDMLRPATDEVRVLLDCVKLDERLLEVLELTSASWALELGAEGLSDGDVPML